MSIRLLRPAGRRAYVLVAALSCAAVAAAMAGGGGGGTIPGDPNPIVPAFIDDFFIPGSQPFSLTDPLAGANDDCSTCHAGGDPSYPYSRWTHSLMGQAARDPVFFACLDIANHDVGFAGDLCIRCHSPRAWISGRSSPTDGSSITGTDFEGVTCSVCHRMIDPVQQDAHTFYSAADTPADTDDEQQIDASRVEVPLPDVFSRHDGSFVLDPEDYRRGPYADVDAGHTGHKWAASPFHKRSSLCGTCHDVSNPAYQLQGDTYVLVADGKPHFTGSKYDMFPIERTFSEWSRSEFAQHAIEMGGRFDNKPGFTKVSTCQHCHMPRAEDGSEACTGGKARNDIGIHNFNGVNTWVLNAVGTLDYDGDGTPDFPPDDTGLTAGGIAAALERTKKILSDGCDMELEQACDTLRVRIINNAGHKLPTGYPEGRRMWINVKFYNGIGQELTDDERGFYNDATAELEGAATRHFDTKVYEAELGVDETIARATGLNGGKAGHTFHFVLNNVYLKDNRIPPRGFSHDSFAEVQAAPVVGTHDDPQFQSHYADGQYWDDTEYEIPQDAAYACVRLRIQATTKEYIEFLRDANTYDSPNRGEIAYDAWVAAGKSAPVDMKEQCIALDTCKAGSGGGGGGGGGVAHLYFVRSSSTGNNDGSTWRHAFKSLSSALAVAHAGDEIWVAEGTYAPAGGSFLIPAGVKVYGGFAGSEEALADRGQRFAKTVLTGKISEVSSASHVVAYAGGSGGVLDGFTVTGGKAQGREPDATGAGVLLTGSGNFVIRNCIVRGNTAEQRGGGIMGNMTGILTVANCAFSGNSGFNGGGGLLVRDGLYAQVVNCTFAGNLSTAGGGILVESGGTAVLSNTILWGNTGPGTGQGAQVSVQPGGGAMANRCCIQGYLGQFGNLDGIGNIGSNPLFQDADGADNIAGTADDDLQLSAGSPCIDAGRNAALPAGAPTDLAGGVRMRDDPATADAPGTTPPAIDMGAYEFFDARCGADLNGDGMVDGADLGRLIAAWGSSGGPADLNGDGSVGGADLGILLGAWGPC